MSNFSREQMIEELVNLADEWDLDDLLQYAKDRLEEHYHSQSDEQVKEDYDDLIGDLL